MARIKWWAALTRIFKKKEKTSEPLKGEYLDKWIANLDENEKKIKNKR